MTGCFRCIRREMIRACSANEVFHLSRKACIGAGLGVDRAEDLAEAVTGLQCSGHAGLDALLRLLQRSRQDGQNAGFDLTFSRDRLLAGRLRPEAEGVAVIDWLVATAGSGVAEISSLCDETIMAGLLISAAHSYGGWFVLRTPGCAGPLQIAGASVLSALPAPEDWHLCYQSGPVSDEQIVCHHTQVELSVWQALDRLAYLTYVPASETSRQTGAGAGLVDND